MARDPIDVVVVRGHLATPWELRQWEALPAERFRASYLRGRSNAYGEAPRDLEPIPVRTTRDRMPKGRLFDVATSVLGERYLHLETAVADADIVHAEELSFWFAAETARLKGKAKIVQTVWETIPFLDAYRNRHARRYRAQVLEATDMFLAATERARDALLLEGVAPERVRVCPPGVDVARFKAAARGERPDEHILLSPGRLVWEKGHQDVLRAVASIVHGMVGDVRPPRLLIAGGGPEEGRLREHAQELGIADRVEFASVPYEEMPSVFARASCMVLASLPNATAQRHLFDIPRAFWEEQFGLVLAEAMAAGLDIVASNSGAIPDVVGPDGCYFPPGHWMGLARRLVAGPLSRAPGERVVHDPQRVALYSIDAAAERLAAAYDEVLALA
jgi:glycosyltransferase involved in cell wall biosynthesis